MHIAGCFTPECPGGRRKTLSTIPFDGSTSSPQASLRAGSLAPFRVRKGKRLYLRDTLRLPAIPTRRDLHFPFFISVPGAPSVHACPRRLALVFWKRGERRGDYRGEGAATSEIGRRMAVSRSLQRRAGAVGRLRTALSNVCGPDGISNRANARSGHRVVHRPTSQT